MTLSVGLSGISLQLGRDLLSLDIGRYLFVKFGAFQAYWEYVRRPIINVGGKS